MLIFSASTTLTFAQNLNQSFTGHPGLFGTFSALIEIDKEKLTNKKLALKSQYAKARDLVDISVIDIDPDFLNSIILNSPSSYLAIAEKDQCLFYDLMITNLLKSSLGPIDDVFIQYQSLAGNTISSLMKKKDFIEKVIYPRCPLSKTLAREFQVKVLQRTINQTNFTMPDNYQQCQSIHFNWLSERKTPYYCQIYEINKRGSDPKLTLQEKRISENEKKLAQVLRSKFSSDQFTLIENICQFADNQEQFCQSLFGENFWQRINNLELANLYIKDICTTREKNWSMAVVKKCLGEIKNNPERCYLPEINASALSPLPNCQQLSTALSFSSLGNHYDDCPRYSGHGGVIGVSRILNFFDNSEMTSNNPICSINAAGTFYEFNRKNDNPQAWGKQLCYKNKLREEEVCFPFFYGDYTNSEASISKVVSQILYETKGAPKKLSCRLVNKNDFNPSLLEYSTGCFIVADLSRCTFSQCDIKIYYNDKEMTHLYEKGSLAFDYFATSLKNETFAQKNLIENDPKRKFTKILNLPQLKSFFKQKKKGIVQGIACREDLLPAFFKKSLLNQCEPVTFIIDAIVEQDGKEAMVVRSDLDDLQAPRLSSWSVIYSAVRSYEGTHPLREWTLYGIN